MPTELPAYKCNVCGKIHIGNDLKDRVRTYQDALICEIRATNGFKFDIGLKFWYLAKDSPANVFGIVERKMSPGDTQINGPAYFVKCLSNLKVKSRWLPEHEVEYAVKNNR